MCDNLERTLSHRLALYILIKMHQKISYHNFCSPIISKEEFLNELSTVLIQLNGIWDRIGIDEESKKASLEDFYINLFETMQSFLDEEEDNEDELMRSIEKNRLEMRSLCFQLGYEYNENFATELSIEKQADALQNEVHTLRKKQRNATKRIPQTR